MIDVIDLRCEYKMNPVGLDVMIPRFSWKLRSDNRDVLQDSYQLQLALTGNDLNNELLVWDTCRRHCDQSVHIEYQGPALLSRQCYYWRVRAWDNHGQKSKWSEQAFFEMGLLTPEEWQAHMISPNLVEEIEKSNPCPLLRKEFQLKKRIESARLYITALGLYEAWINGIRVGSDLFTPGWTNYSKCLQYQVYDVTENLKEGDNAIGVILADGWYRGHLSFLYLRNIYGEKLHLYGQLEIHYQDGTKETIITDGSWKSSTGPWLESDFYDGEIYDANREIPGWNTVGYDDSSWQGVTQIEFDNRILRAPTGVAIRKMEEKKPVSIIITPAGETVIDFGQNMAGWIRCALKGTTGTVVSFSYSEVLDAKGNFYNKNLRYAKSRDIYIIKGTGTEYFEPRFTYHGFRYVKVEGCPAELSLDDIIGIVIRSDLEITAELTTTNTLINQLFHNIVWSQKSNFVDVPTDCPQRDERLGWGGDLLIYSPTACHIMASGAFITRWLRDLAIDQKANGAVPMVIPDPHIHKDQLKIKLEQRRKQEHASRLRYWLDYEFVIDFLDYTIALQDAAVFVPWYMYLYYADTRILELQYDSMTRLFKYHEKQAHRIDSLLWINPFKWLHPMTWKHIHNFYTAGWHWGDWLEPGETLEKSIFKSKLFLPTIFFALDALLLSKIAAILNKDTEADYYNYKFEEIKRAYQFFRLKRNGRLWPHCQTHYVLALFAHLLPEKDRQPALENLVSLIRSNNNSLQTGFLGTPFICRILSENGYTHLAYDLLMRQSSPSWLYQVTRGATTVWEHWNAIKEDGSFQSERMLSFNHYALGSIGLWLIQTIGGINIDESHPGYKQFIIKPQPGGGITHASVSCDSIYGKIISEWDLSGNEFILKVTVPPNTRAKVMLPDYHFVSVIESTGNAPVVDKVIETGSGEYKFVCKR